MKKIFISIFLISFVFNFANAQESNQSKYSNKKELSKEDEDFMKEFMSVDKQVQIEKEKQAKLDQIQIESKAKTLKSESELNTSKKLGKTLDEINKLLGTDSKKK